MGTEQILVTDEKASLIIAIWIDTKVRSTEVQFILHRSLGFSELVEHRSRFKCKLIKSSLLLQQLEPPKSRIVDINSRLSAVPVQLLLLFPSVLDILVRVDVGFQIEKSVFEEILELGRFLTVRVPQLSDMEAKQTDEECHKDRQHFLVLQ